MRQLWLDEVLEQGWRQKLKRLSFLKRGRHKGKIYLCLFPHSKGNVIKTHPIENPLALDYNGYIPSMKCCSISAMIKWKILSPIPDLSSIIFLTILSPKWPILAPCWGACYPPKKIPDEPSISLLGGSIIINSQKYDQAIKELNRYLWLKIWWYGRKERSAASVIFYQVLFYEKRYI